MDIRLNGEPFVCADAASVADLLKKGGFDPVRVAVLLNGDVVARGDFAARRLGPGDEVEVVSFVGGG